MPSPRRTSALTALLALTLPGLALVAAGPVGPAGAAALKCQGQPVTIVATDVGEELQGTAGPDVIHTAGFSSVTVRAGGGDDLVCAAAGTNGRIHGDAGDDTLVDEVRAAEDRHGAGTVFLGGAGADHFVATRSTWISYQDATAGVSIDASGTVVSGADTDTFVGRPKIRGSRLRDHYVGTRGDDLYISGPRRDTGQEGDVISSGAGNDLVDAVRGSVDLGPGNDRANGDGATVSGGDGADTITLSQGGTALGGAGADRIEGGVILYPGHIEQSLLRLFGGPGDDVISTPHVTRPGVAGCPTRCAQSVLQGGAGTDTLDLDWQDSVVDLALGRARMRGGVAEIRSFERVVGSFFDDVVRGDAGRNRLEGRGRNDLLVGRGGRDVLIGGSGQDRAEGGSGRDRCEAEVRRSC
jgi:Ca2+-binding RTX toxin-like protein